MINTENKEEVSNALRALAEAVLSGDVLVSQFSWTIQEVEIKVGLSYVMPGKVEIHGRSIS